MSNTKKQRKTIEWERLEIAARKLKIPREYFMQRSDNKGQKWKDLTEVEEIKKKWQ